MKKKQRDILFEEIDPVEQQVTQAMNKSRRLIHQALKIETKLSLRSEVDEDNDSNGVQIPIKVDPALPESIVELERSPDFAHIMKLVEYRGVLENVKRGVSGLGMLRQDLSRMPDPDKWIGAKDDELQSVMNWAEMLLKQIDEYDPVRRILNYNEDVLGLYRFYTNHNPYDDKHPNRAEIYLYWKVIERVSMGLNVAVEDLTIVVLAHELSHAYTQLGADANGQRWSAQKFGAASTELVEGLAQYYTERVLNRLQNRFPNAINAYQLLLGKQPPAYSTHLPWVNTATPEVVRRSLLEIRRTNETTVFDFENRLASARKDLDVSGRDNSIFQ